MFSTIIPLNWLEVSLLPLTSTVLNVTTEEFEIYTAPFEIEENTTINQSLQIANELNKLGNALSLNVVELLNEVDAYTDYYYDEPFFVESSMMNEEDEKKISNMIKKGETIFDRVNETVMRNEIVNKLEEIVSFLFNK